MFASAGVLFVQPMVSQCSLHIRSSQGHFFFKLMLGSQNNQNLILEDPKWGLSISVFFLFVYFFNFFKNLLFIYYFQFWLCWVPASARGPPPAAASGGHSSSRCAGLPPSRPLPLRSRGSRRSGSAVVAHGPSRSAARGILPDQGPERASPALAGRLPTTAPPGKPQCVFKASQVILMMQG